MKEGAKGEGMTMQLIEHVLSSKDEPTIENKLVLYVAEQKLTSWTCSICLIGCVNDTAIMKGFLQDRGFEDDKIRILTDDQVGTCWMPTREKILENLKWLIRDAKKNDSYVSALCLK
jgi:hypothetical protein